MASDGTVIIQLGTSFPVVSVLGMKRLLTERGDLVIFLNLQFSMQDGPTTKVQSRVPILIFQHQ